MDDLIQNLKQGKVILLRDGFSVNMKLKSNNNNKPIFNANVSHNDIKGEGKISLVYDGDAPSVYSKNEPGVPFSLRVSEIYNNFDTNILPKSRGIMSIALCSALQWLSKYVNLNEVNITFEASGYTKGDPDASDESAAGSISSMSKLVKYYQRHFGVDILRSELKDEKVFKDFITKGVENDEIVGITMVAPLSKVIKVCMNS